MKKKKIYSDIILGFGKYKGKTVVDVLATDPGYFLWLEQAGMADLSNDVKEVVYAWAKANVADAKKTVASALRVKKEESVVFESSSSSDNDSVTTEVKYMPKMAEHSADPNWGAW